MTFLYHVTLDLGGNVLLVAISKVANRLTMPPPCCTPLLYLPPPWRKILYGGEAAEELFGLFSKGKFLDPPVVPPPLPIVPPPVFFFRPKGRVHRGGGMVLWCTKNSIGVAANYHPPLIDPLGSGPSS